MTHPKPSRPTRRPGLALWSRVGLALALACAAGASMAAPIHFNFENSGTEPVAPTDSQPHDSLSFSRPGVGLNVTAIAGFGTFAPVTSAFNPGAGVYFGSSGLGVALGQGTDDSNNLDGSDDSSGTDMDEALVFRFDRLVQLVAINFGQWDTGFDSIRFVVDGVEVLTHAGANDEPALALVGREFRLFADTDATGVRIQDLDVLLVPEPGSLALALAGLGLGALARRQPRHAPR